MFCVKFAYSDQYVATKIMPLPSLPNDFYYFPREGRLQYSHTPQGDIDIDRLTASNPAYWINPALSRGKKKKKLILTNLFLFNFKAGTPLFSTIIDDLIQEGFEVYYWTGWSHDELRRLSIGPLLDINYPRFHSEAYNDHPDKIMDIMVSINPFSRDELQIIDNFGVENLLEEWAESEKIRERRYTMNTTFTGIVKNIPIIEHLDHTITHIFHSRFSKDDIRNFINIKKMFLNAEVMKDYNVVMLDATETKLFAEAMSKNENYSLEGQTFTPVDLINLLRVDLDCSAIKGELITSLLGKTSKLFGCSLEYCDTPFKIKNNTMDWLDISHSKLTVFFEHCPNLSSIRFYDSTVLDLQLVPGQLNTVRRIGLYDCSIDFDCLDKLIDATPKLEELDLSGCKTTGEELPIVRLNHLTTLKINVNQGFILNQLNMLTLIAPKFKSLTLEGPYNSALKPLIASLRARGVSVDWQEERDYFYFFGNTFGGQQRSEVISRAPIARSLQKKTPTLRTK